VAIVVATLDIVGGHGVQAAEVVAGLQRDGYRVLIVPVNPRFPWGLRWLRRVPRVRTVLNELIYVPSLLRLAQADVVHLFSAAYTGFLFSTIPALVVARVLGKRVVLHYHSGEASDHLARWGRLVHPWLKLADVIVVPSTYLARVFAGYGYHTCVIHNVVDPARFRYRERRAPRARLLSNRNLEPHYGVDDILAAFALVKARVPEATLTVAGAGSDEVRLRRLAVEGVRFLGSVPPPRMPELLTDADLLVNASTVDNQPVSILEAFASGLPVVSTPTGDIATMLGDGRRGVVVPASDPAALAAGILRLLEDPPMALAMAREAHDALVHYTWPAVHDAWAAVYAGTAEAPPSALDVHPHQRPWPSRTTR
jgi:glycosyltransferase involved in cell wall biosynthesis